MSLENVHWTWTYNGSKHIDPRLENKFDDMRGVYSHIAEAQMIALRDSMRAAKLATGRMERTYYSEARVTTTAGPGINQILVDLMAKPQRRKPVSLPEYEKKEVPYLWIGIKQINNRDEVEIHACLWEPDAVQTEGLIKPQILSNRGKWIGYGSAVASYLPINKLNELVIDEESLSYGLRGYVAEKGWEDTSKLVYDPESPDKSPEWDITIVIDPFEGESIIPMSKDELEEYRRQVQQPEYEDDDGKAPREFKQRENMPTDDRAVIPIAQIEAETGFSDLDKVLAGEYCLKLMAYGDDCINLPPTEVQIEVVTLKAPHTTSFTRTVSIAEKTELYRGLLPGGYYPGEGKSCGYSGFNPHKNHWWQGAILTSPFGGTRDVDYHLPNWGFAESDGWPSRESLCPKRRYVYLGGAGARVSRGVITRGEPLPGGLPGQMISWATLTISIQPGGLYGADEVDAYAGRIAANSYLNPDGMTVSEIAALFPAALPAYYPTTSGSQAPIGMVVKYGSESYTEVWRGEEYLYTGANEELEEQFDKSGWETNYGANNSGGGSFYFDPVTKAFTVLDYANTYFPLLKSLGYTDLFIEQGSLVQYDISTDPPPCE